MYACKNARHPLGSIIMDQSDSHGSRPSAPPCLILGMWGLEAMSRAHTQLHQIRIRRARLQDHVGWHLVIRNLLVLTQSTGPYYQPYFTSLLSRYAFLRVRIVYHNAKSYKPHHWTSLTTTHDTLLLTSLHFDFTSLLPHLLCLRGHVYSLL